MNWLLIAMAISVSSSVYAEEFGKEFAEANCFLHGYAPLKDPKKFMKTSEPVRNRIRLRFKFDSETACRQWVREFCKSEILENERKVADLKGYYKTKSSDGNPDHAILDRFVVDKECQVRSSSSE